MQNSNFDRRYWKKFVSGVWHLIATQYRLGKRSGSDCGVREPDCSGYERVPVGTQLCAERKEQKLGSRITCIWIHPATAHEARLHSLVKMECRTDWTGYMSIPSSLFLQLWPHWRPLISPQDNSSGLFFGPLVSLFLSHCMFPFDHESFMASQVSLNS